VGECTDGRIQCRHWAPTSSLITSAKEVMFLPVFVCLVCLSVCQQDNSKSYGRIFLKFWGYVGRGINYQWFNFGGDPAGIVDSESLWNFRYHCVKEGIREPLAKRRWWMANNIALAEVPAGYDCFLVVRSTYAFECSVHVFRLCGSHSKTHYALHSISVCLVSVPIRETSSGEPEIDRNYVHITQQLFLDQRAR